MHVICTAVIEEERQRANLSDCVEILGGESQISGNTVCVEYDGEKDVANKFVELFKQFPFHGISVL